MLNLYCVFLMEYRVSLFCYLSTMQGSMYMYVRTLYFDLQLKGILGPGEEGKDYSWLHVCLVVSGSLNGTYLCVCVCVCTRARESAIKYNLCI